MRRAIPEPPVPRAVMHCLHVGRARAVGRYDVIALGLMVVVLATFTLLPRWTRRRVRVTGVARVRSEMARHQWPPLSPLTPADGYPSPRNEPSAGPKQPDGSPGDLGIGEPPTFGFTSPPQAAVRCRRTVMFGALESDMTRPRRAA